MAAKLLLPGFGGKYTSEVFTSSSTIGADTIDVSHCAQFAIQVNTSDAVGSIQVEQSFNGTDWASLGSAFNVASTGEILRYGPVDGPYGLIRINATGIDSGSTSLTIVGDPVQGMF